MEEKLTQEGENAMRAELIGLHNEMEGLDKKIIDKISLRRQREIRSGEVLIELKESLGHGNFEMWVEQNLPYSFRTAQRYMRRAREKNDNLSHFKKVEDYAAMIDPNEREQDRWDRMMHDLEKRQAEGKGQERKKKQSKKKKKRILTLRTPIHRTPIIQETMGQVMTMRKQVKTSGASFSLLKEDNPEPCPLMIQRKPSNSQGIPKFRNA
jgi:hypothetical protein